MINTISSIKPLYTMHIKFTNHYRISSIKSIILFLIPVIQIEIQDNETFKSKGIRIAFIVWSLYVYTHKMKIRNYRSG